MALGVHGVGTLHKKNLDLMQMQKAKMDDQQLEWKMNKKSSLDENFKFKWVWMCKMSSSKGLVLKRS